MSFEATYVSARGSHIDTVSTVAARYVAACIVLFKDFIVAEFEFVQVKRTNFDDKLSFKWGVSRPNKRRSQTVASLELYSLLCQKMKNLVAAASAREDTVLHTTHSFMLYLSNNSHTVYFLRTKKSHEHLNHCVCSILQLSTKFKF